MKDDPEKNTMSEFVALWAKIFTYRNIDTKSEIKDCKGANRYAVAENYACIISSLYKGSVI